MPLSRGRFNVNNVLRMCNNVTLLTISAGYQLLHAHRYFYKRENSALTNARSPLWSIMVHPASLSPSVHFCLEALISLITLSVLALFPAVTRYRYQRIDRFADVYVGISLTCLTALYIPVPTLDCYF